MKLTAQMVHDAATNYCGWNKAQTDLLGVPWPLPQGWVEDLEGMEILDENWDLVLKLRGLKGRSKRREVLQGQARLF